ncbi:ABC transporter substrate-binding protein [Thalassotalea sp. 1_MG-2023]|uniref:ABC transporter substrate-binding protein n=1 Tax=Thalassotalea sp. 1_MG-2023 TaxID=3062680 RepID=UPI0026E16D83|nr:ABC transporter substrate-binding protein [Thalassotalea sp. 1_MG-2023]MDO6425878.1 ABC transporter substrate-binding protein [Thalassotalea sp. 1_MG-2023]
MKKYIVLWLMLSPLAFGQEKVVLQLKWFHQFQFAGYYAALEKGYYQDAGFDVEIKERDINTSVIENVLSGKADFAVGDSSIVAAKLKGQPLVVATTIFQSSPLIFMSLKSSGIASPYDFNGKKIMFQRNLDDASLNALLEMFNVSNYEFVAHTFNNNALLNGTADVMSAYRSNQPFIYDAKGIDYNIIDPSSYGIDFYGDLLFTTEQRVKRDLSSVKRFVSATHKGWLYALKHQQEIAQLIKDKYRAKNTLINILKEAKATEVLIKPNIVPIGSVFPARFSRAAQVYQNLNMAPEDGSLTGLLLRDYETKPYEINSRIFYIVLSCALLFVAYLLVQMRFNKRLKRIVNEQTKTLESNNKQLKQHVELLSEQKRRIEVAKQKEEAANNAKSLFLANMSHEIRTPMNGVLGTIQLLQDMPQSDEARDLLEKASYSSEMLLTIIDDILDFSKINAHKLTLEKKPFNLDILLEVLSMSLTPVAEEKHIKFSIIKGRNYQQGWLGDSVRVKQILLNLSSNAVKFTNVGEVNVLVDTDKQGALFIQVQDSGIGMKQEAIDRLYNRFEQADNTTTRKYGGTGLGMSICKSLIDMMNGSIEVESKPQKGTTFEVVLPITQADVTQQRLSTKKLSAPDLRGKTVLLAEDNRINQTIFSSMMKPTNVDLIITNNGQEAIDMLANKQVDLIFMDIQMPVMDGLQAQKIINKLYPSIPVIALTANVMEEDIKQYLAQGFVYHLGKPIDTQQLFHRCLQYLS